MCLIVKNDKPKIAKKDITCYKLLKVRVGKFMGNEWTQHYLSPFQEYPLLLKDLSARLSYGVEASVRGSDEECISFEVLGIKGNLVWVRNKMLLVDHFETIEVIKPYLRPMSSMTEEENKEYHNLCYEEERECYEFGEWTTRIYFHDTIDSIDWLLSHHFDFRGLISKGLALEAPEDMYKEE